MDVVGNGHDLHFLKKEGWIPCTEKLPPAAQFVRYRTPKYEALGKLESQTWYFSGHQLEREESPVLCWHPLN